MRFVLLGPVEGWSGDRLVELGTVRQRCVLVAMMVPVARPVTVEVLIDRVWGDAPPNAARGALYSYVARIRRSLREFGVDVCRRSGGYQLLAGEDAADLWRWDRLRRQARKSFGAGRAELLGGALELWRGRPLDNLDGQWVEQVRETVTRQYIETLADWAEVAIELGRPAAVAERLAEPVLAYPSAERLVAAHMRALHLSGRTAEALESFARSRKRTAADLGVEPSGSLRELHLELLRADRAGEPARVRTGLAPAQLPAPVADFTGREEPIRLLNRLVSKVDDPALAIAVITGGAGVGKTALATHWAHRVAGRFPDGQLYLDLHGYAPGPTVKPARALELMLRALGVSGDRIPPDLEARAGLYRTMLAGKRMLVFLDNAVGSEHVRALLPGQPGCLVLATSRDSLGGLVAMDGARRIALDVMDDTEALALLDRLLGADRVVAEPKAAARLAELCVGLPLALRIAAANLTPRPLADQVEALAADRLDSLAVDGDPQAVVIVHFDHSYRRLGADERRLFRGFGYLPGADISTEGAAALVKSTVDDAAALLDRLTDAHLVERHRPGRYTCHDLLREYAARCPGPSGERDAALRRLYQWYLDGTILAMDRIDPHRRRLTEATPADPGISLGDYQQAMTWLETERPNLLEVVSAAAGQGWNGYAWRIPQTLWRFFYIRGYLQDWQTTHRLALIAARRDGDPLAQAEILNNLATAERRAGQHRRALELHLEALEQTRRIGDRAGEAAVLGNLGVIYQRTGRHTEAIKELRRALALHRELGNIRPQATTLGNLGVVYEEQGRYRAAVVQYRRALEVFRAVGDELGQAIALANLGIVYQRLGQYPEALDHQRQALVLQRHHGDRQGEAAVLANLGYTYCKLARYPEAFDHQHQALALARQIGDADLESEIHNDLGQTHGAAGQYGDALARHQRALGMAEATGNRLQLARAHHGIARAQHAAGEHGLARGHWQPALRLYTELGVAEAGQLRAELAGLDPHCLDA